MDIRLGFDPREDRIVLVLTDDHEQHAYWLTRRQCIALLKACQAADNDTAPSKNALSRGKGQAKTEKGTELPPKLADLALRRVAKGLRLTLKASDSRPINLLLKPDDQVMFKRKLVQLANRAQWDLDAAEARSAAIQALQAVPRRLH